jgi:hypothetical protein
LIDIRQNQIEKFQQELDQQILQEKTEAMTLQTATDQPVS